MLFNQGIPS
jgi:hypothetical protein